VFFAFIAFFFVVLPLAEIAVGIQVSHVIGVGNTLLLIAAFSIIGGWVAWQMGFSVLRRTRYSLAQGVVPTDELIDAALVFTGGILLFIPGFITDVVGLLLLVPPTRHLVRSALKHRFRARVVRYGPGPSGPYGSSGPNIIDV
jgi:UPF0716 protein FxsA